MLLGIYQVTKQCNVVAATRSLWLLTYCLIALICGARDSELYAAEATSLSSEPLSTQFTINNVLPNTDVSCFKLVSPQNTEPIHLEYTTLSNQQGRLTLWSEHAITSTLKLILIDQCQQTQQRLTIRTDQAVITTRITNTLSKTNESATPLETETTSTIQPTPVEAYSSLQAQINDLQASFIELQTKSDVLYANNLAQNNILTTLKVQLTHLQNENHLLRTLVIALGLTLIASGFFFAYWLRSNATPAKTSKTSHSGGMRDNLISHTHNSGPLTLPPNDLQAANPQTQSLFQANKTNQRLKSVTTQTKDDAVAPHLVSQKSSPLQTTQSVLQDASHMFTHGRVNQAIDLLQQHLTKHPKCSPWMWLYLLDLLSKEGKQQEFDIVAGECRKHFNLDVEHTSNNKKLGIESLPRVMKALQQTWGTPEVITLINDLVYNTRLVPRMGFERSIFEELMLLKEIACQTQNLPQTSNSKINSTSNDNTNGNLIELQELAEDIDTLTPAENSEFQYWTDFTFELDEQSALRKSA